MNCIFAEVIGLRSKDHPNSFIKPQIQRPTQCIVCGQPYPIKTERQEIALLQAAPMQASDPTRDICRGAAQYWGDFQSSFDCQICTYGLFQYLDAEHISAVEFHTL